MNRENSFTSADALPLKLFYHQDIHQFKPIHIQWIPTNSCNLNCPPCSCAQRDKSLCMDIEESRDIISNFSERGCKAVTITGGGEPLTHPYITEMINEFFYRGIKIGLVTNGLLLYKLSRETLRKITWCRISSMDYRTFDIGYEDMLSKVVESEVDWSFSHVVTNKPNMETIGRIVNFANRFMFTHVRLVADLLKTEETDPTFRAVRSYLKDVDKLVIYQPRNNPIVCTECMICYVKPVVGPDFQMYLCCGVQYALKEQLLDLPNELCMGSAKDLNAVYKTIKPFRTECITCYYSQYNKILTALYEGMIHKEFI